MSDDFFDKLMDYQAVPFQHLKGCPGGPPMILFGGIQSCMWCSVANSAYELGRKETEEKYVNLDCVWGEGECIPNCPSCKFVSALYDERRKGYEEGRRETEAPEEGFNW